MITMHPQGPALHPAIRTKGGNTKPWITSMKTCIHTIQQRHIQCRTAVELAGGDGGTKTDQLLTTASPPNQATSAVAATMAREEGVAAMMEPPMVMARTFSLSSRCICGWLVCCCDQPI